MFTLSFVSSGNFVKNDNFCDRLQAFATVPPIVFSYIDLPIGSNKTVMEVPLPLIRFWREILSSNLRFTAG
jgi:hypothetical protein